MIVNSKAQAWEEVNKIFPTDYEKDEGSSQRAGYDIYRHPTLNYYARICDLGDRLEILTGKYGNEVTNIWIKEPKNPGLAVLKEAAIEAIREFNQLYAIPINDDVAHATKITAAAIRSTTLQEAYAILLNIRYDMAAEILHEAARGGETL